ncbi:ribonuclease T2 [Salinihabitans flavidus]|uniref:Ribonuclease T2 n=1 Tax=Salinihabitans flavidus TaxID=569882 RepID=A0A1H8MKC1_9RHOB|nr:ribonuclease T2 [Salinihabitans flavidus]SEO17862.1 ribonuclease T2 [Salinihabitans flavidus]
MRPVILFLCGLILALPAATARADGEPAGVFDYYLLSLSWSPNWCALDGDARGAAPCETGGGHGWVLHGLWPQYHRGWPAFCPTATPNPPRALTRSMADIMGTPGLAWYQWKKHGRCSGLAAEDYFALSRRAYDSIARPPMFRTLTDPVRLPASVVEEAFLRANPSLTEEMITITCRDGHIQEARICLSKDLAPVPCGRDVSRDCAARNAHFKPLR